MERSTRQTRAGPSVAAAVARQQAPQRMEVVVAPVAPQQQYLLKDSPIERSKLSLARGLRIWATPPLDERIFRRPQRQQIRVPLNDIRLNDTPRDLLIRKLFCELIQRRLGGLINFNQIVAMEQKGYQLVFPQASHNTALVVPENVRIEGIMQRVIDSDNSGYDLGQPASTHILESIHCTLIMFRGRYVLIFLDDFSQYVTVYTPNMRNDHYVYDSLEKFYLKISECMVLPQDDEIQIVRHSIGTMFMHDFPSQFDVENWHDYFSAKEYPLKIERAIGPSRVSAVGQMLTESAEQMLTNAGLNRSIFTEYAVEYAAYCLNHILNPITGTTPIERWTYWPDQPNLPQPTLHHLAVFGCHAKRTEKELVDAVFLGCTEPNCGPYGYDVQNYCYSERNGFQSFVTWCMRFSENHYVFNPRSPAHMQVN